MNAVSFRDGADHVGGLSFFLIALHVAAFQCLSSDLRNSIEQTLSGFPWTVRRRCAAPEPALPRIDRRAFQAARARERPCLEAGTLVHSESLEESARRRRRRLSGPPLLRREPPRKTKSAAHSV